jgi:hypothetical protein
LAVHDVPHPKRTLTNAVRAHRSRVLASLVESAMEGESTSTPAVSAEAPVMGEAVSTMMSVVMSETVSAVMSPTERAAVTPGMMSPALSAVLPVSAVMPVSGMSCPTEFAVMSMTTVMRPTASAPLTAPAMMVMTVVVSDPGITAVMASPVSSMMSSVPVISVMFGPMSLILTSFVILASPFAPAVAVTAIGLLMARPSLFVVAAPTALGSLSPVLSALGTPLSSMLSAFVIAALGKFVPIDVAMPPTTCPRTIVGLFAICVTFPSARSVVPPIAAFVVPSATIVVSAVTAIVRQFVRSDLVGLRRSPVQMDGELHQSGSCQPSQKHQHVASHSIIPSPDSRPFDSRGKGNHNRATLTEGEAA